MIPTDKREVVLVLELVIGKELRQGAATAEAYSQWVDASNNGGNTVRPGALREVESMAKVANLALVDHGWAEIMSKANSC